MNVSNDSTSSRLRACSQSCQVGVQIGCYRTLHAWLLAETSMGTQHRLRTLMPHWSHDMSAWFTRPEVSDMSITKYEQLATETSQKYSQDQKQMITSSGKHSVA